MQNTLSQRGPAACKVLRMRQARPARLVATGAFTVRPYTVRKGDTLSSIARKRGYEVSELVKLNHEVNPDDLKEGQTLLLPAGSLSERDREIIKGMDRGQYRTYPVRRGEKLADVLEKRKISMAEFTRLNPDVDPEKISADMIVKLPTNKFTVREREMLTGSGILPAEFFSPVNAGVFAAGIAVGVAAYAAVSFAVRRQQDDDDDDDAPADRA